MDFSKVYDLRNVGKKSLEHLVSFHQKEADRFIDEFNRLPSDDPYSKFAQANCQLYIGIRNYLQSVVDDRAEHVPEK